MSLAVISRAFCLALLTAGTVLSTSHNFEDSHIHEDAVDIGNWTVGDCILAKFAMDFTIHTDKGNGTKMSMPSSALATKDNNGTMCSKDVKKEQTLILSWKEPQKNDTRFTLERWVHVSFLRMPNSSFYGVSRFYGEFDIAMYTEDVKNTTSNKTHTETLVSTLSMDSKQIDRLMFHTPNDNSYLCADVGEVSLISTMKYNYTTSLPLTVDNTTMHALHVQFDAFRNIANVAPGVFRTSIDCNAKSNDIVPIVVGIALAALVIAVLIAYMVGRRRNRYAGYQSV